MPSAHRSCRYLLLNESLSNSRRKFAYNSCALFYMCCKYNILLTREMWTIIVSTAITLQTVETTCPNGNVVYASELAVKAQTQKNKNTGKNTKYFRRSNLPLQYDNHLTIYIEMNGNLQSQIRLFQNERCTRFQEGTDHL